MRICIVLLGSLGSEPAMKRVELNLAEGATVRETLASLGKDDLEYASAILDSTRAYDYQTLKDGDVLYVFRAIAGG
ncbi:MAG: MoaD/ThiS family protein [Deltaproteobacteria bacterium]|nr:MoaD/ThiS family protein [Deltaproteobacteria bacterium]